LTAVEITFHFRLSTEPNAHTCRPLLRPCLTLTSSRRAPSARGCRASV